MDDNILDEVRNEIGVPIRFMSDDVNHNIIEGKRFPCTVRLYWTFDSVFSKEKVDRIERLFMRNFNGVLLGGVLVNIQPESVQYKEGSIGSCGSNKSGSVFSVYLDVLKPEVKSSEKILERKEGRIGYHGKKLV